MQNYNGIKIGKQITDFTAGANSPLNNININLSGDWDLNRPEHELQNKGFETFACLLFSGFDCVETLFMYYLKHNLISSNNVSWLGENGYFDKGFINFSDRFAAQFAEIEIGKGTYSYKANNAIRKYLIPESMLPYTTKNYYDKNAITEEMIEMAKEFNKRFIINWQWEEIPTNGLKKSPLQAIVRYATGNEILQPTGKLNHGIEVYKEDQESYYIDDSYLQRDKRYNKNYVFYFVSYTLTIINNKIMDTKKFIEKNDLKFIRNQNTGAFGRILNNKLRIAETKDRGVLMLLDKAHRENGITIADNEWKQLPADKF